RPIGFAACAVRSPGACPDKPHREGHPAYREVARGADRGYALKRRADPGEGSAMKTQYFTATSLDGFIATEDDSLDWLFPLGNLGDTGYPEFIGQVGALAMGSATYEWMLRNAVQVAASTGAPWPYTQPAWVFTTRTLPGIDGADIRFTRGDVRPVHDEMRL